MEFFKNIATAVNSKRSTYKKTCTACLQDEKNLEGCGHCKRPGCANTKSVGRSICDGCFNKDRREHKNRLKGPTVERIKHTKYPGVCPACQVHGQKKCDHCKKSNCAKNKMKGRQVCDSCDKQDGVKASQNYRKRKVQSVFFSAKRTEHAREEKSILQEFKNKKQKSVHYTHPQIELQNNCLPAHQYTEFQFYNKELLEETMQSGEGGSSKIKVLANGDNGSYLKDCFPMNRILKDIADAGKAMLRSEPGASVFSLGAATLHIQDDDEAQSKTTSIYPPHRDKAGVGKFVMFHQLSGLSFTLIAVEGKEEGAHFDTSSQGWERYQEWKAHSGNEASDKLQKFEKVVFKQALENKKATSVEVYELRAGQSLCFPADYLCHGSIVPAQIGDTRRALLVFHELIAVPRRGSQTRRRIPTSKHRNLSEQLGGINNPFGGGENERGEGKAVRQR
jgi:hypothetical protein